MEASRDRYAGSRAGYNALRKFGRLSGLVEAARGCCAGNRLVTKLGGSWDGEQVLWKLSGVVVQVAGLVTTPGRSIGGDQVLWKLPGVVVQVTGLVKTPRGT